MQGAFEVDRRCGTGKRSRLGEGTIQACKRGEGGFSECVLIPAVDRSLDGVGSQYSGKSRWIRIGEIDGRRGPGRDLFA